MQASTFGLVLAIRSSTAFVLGTCLSIVRPPDAGWLPAASTPPNFAARGPPIDIAGPIRHVVSALTYDRFGRTS
jgi:hypothetical protein